jgi:hypothetical protein
MSALEPDKLAAARRRLADRYVMRSTASARSAFLGRSGLQGQGSDGRIASVALRVWPKVKNLPVVGPLAYRLYRFVRGRAT